MNSFYVNQKVPAKGLKNNEYDVIIVGAGIGGLTCGCYLVKAGLKVLIVEQHNKPGGYCTSFKRKGFTFDATTHYIGSFRENGILRIIYNELELKTGVDIVRFDPSNIIMFPEFKIQIRTDMEATISELQDNFKHEAENIDKFFKFIWNSEFTSLYLHLKDQTFKDLLDSYFKDSQLKSVLGVFLLNIGLPPSKASALAVAVLFKEFVIDGGYYPVGGMQVFSDAFAVKFQEWGGDIVLGKKVTKIVIKNNNVEGVVIDQDNFVLSKKVVSNCDATQTFLHLVGKEYIREQFIKKINNFDTSPSAFLVYLGIKKNKAKFLKNRSSWWCSLSKGLNIEKVFSDMDRPDKPYIEDCFLCFFPSSHAQSLALPDNEVVSLFVPAKIRNDEFWKKKRQSVADDLIAKAESFMPGLSNAIAVKETATPLTMNRYTLNKNGAAYGWASTASQVAENITPSTSGIKGLFLAGHWTSLTMGPGGISTVAYCGKKTANLIIRSY